MSELISHCYDNCLDRCEEKWLWKLWGRHCHCPNFHCYYNQRHQNVYPDITHKKCLSFAENSYAKPWLQVKENRVSERMVPLLQSNGCKNRGSWPVCLFVTWDPSILHQAVDNLEAKSEPYQLTNVCAGHHVRKLRNAWPVNNTWDSNHAFLRGLTRC